MAGLKVFNKHLRSMVSTFINYEQSAVLFVYGKIRTIAWLASWVKRMTSPISCLCSRLSSKRQAMSVSFFQSSIVNWIPLKWFVIHSYLILSPINLLCSTGAGASIVSWSCKRYIQGSKAVCSATVECLSNWGHSTVYQLVMVLCGCVLQNVPYWESCRMGC